MKRLVVVLSAVAAVAVVGCGGGGSPTPAPTPQGKFTNADLNGTYAFSMSGTDAGVNFGAFIARVGSFTANGNGSITAALEDVTDAGSLPQLVQFTGGSYSIQANGKGTLTLTSASGGLQLSIVLNSSKGGVLVQTDLNATSSGSFALQTPAMFTQTAINGSYAFDVSGLTSGGGPSSVVGQINANGSGNISGGLFDANDAGTLSSAQAIPAGGTYVMDAANGSTFGRGTMNFAGLSFVFYIVDGTHIKLMESDGNFITFGDALQQSNGIALQNSGFKGDFTFLIGGSAVLGTGGPVARAAAFTADGGGNVGAIALDDNDAGTVKSITGSTTVSNTTYAIDTANAGSGRGTVTFNATSNPNLGTFSFVFYQVSPTQAFIQDTSNGIIGDGTMFAQGSSLTQSGLAGNYALNWSGVNLGSSQNATFEVDADALYALSSSGSISGEIDLIEPGSTSSTPPVFTGVNLTGMFTVSGNGTGANGFTVTAQTSPSNTFHYKAYIVSDSLMLLVGSDTDRVIAGNASLQP